MVRESTRNKVRESIEPNKENTLLEIVERSGFTDETTRRALFQLCMDYDVGFRDNRQTGGTLMFWIKPDGGKQNGARKYGQRSV